MRACTSYGEEVLPNKLVPVDIPCSYKRLICESGSKETRLVREGTVEVNGYVERVRDVLGAMGAEDDRHGIDQRAVALLAGGWRADALCCCPNVDCLDPFCPVWKLLIVQRKSMMALCNECMIKRLCAGIVPNLEDLYMLSIDRDSCMED